ncbi:f-box only protein 3 [Caerostris extrusa]|uniref:F-box only protein 3 n=1 Tax=Caerostris extrusa TaxID=172846 RepID=A0AAV4SZB5_CAEEX|nr:f-box only protein 3 [Caerostris extrusa]
MSVRASLCDLPAEIISIIFSHLDYSDLKNCRLLNKRYYELSKEEQHWKKLCEKYWLQTFRPYGRKWEDHFIHWYRDMGAYINCYAHLKQTWDRIISYFKVNCPTIYKSIKDGVTEEDLNEAERKVGKLPPDFRCSYRIHDGQNLTSPGLMGSMSIPGHYRSECLLELNTISNGYREQEGLVGCIPLTLCLHSGTTQYLAVTDSDGYKPNTIFYPSEGDPANGSRFIDAFISGSSFEDWLSAHASHLENEEFPILQDQPYLFLHDSAAEETTNLITVSVATCFLPEISTICPPKFLPCLSYYHVNVKGCPKNRCLSA